MGRGFPSLFVIFFFSIISFKRQCFLMLNLLIYLVNTYQASAPCWNLEASSATDRQAMISLTAGVYTELSGPGFRKNPEIPSVPSSHYLEVIVDGVECGYIS